MEKAPEHEPRDMRELIYRGVESEELDYKAAMSWTAMSRAARAKIVRHCLALANTKGGYIVIGVGEDASGHPSVYQGLTPEETQERAALRREYIDTVVGNLARELDNTWVVDENGNKRKLRKRGEENTHD